MLGGDETRHAFGRKISVRSIFSRESRCDLALLPAWIALGSNKVNGLVLHLDDIQGNLIEGTEGQHHLEVTRTPMHNRALLEATKNASVASIPTRARVVIVTPPT